MFKNRGLAFKLGLGFGLLIIFTLVVAVVGYLRLDGMISRAKKMDAFNEISDSISNARLDVLYFTGTKDQTKIDTFRKHLGAARDNAQSIKLTLNDPRNRERMEAFIAAIAAYDAGFNRYLESEKQRDETFKAVVEAAGALQKIS